MGLRIIIQRTNEKICASEISTSIKVIFISPKITLILKMNNLDLKPAMMIFVLEYDWSKSLSKMSLG